MYAVIVTFEVQHDQIAKFQALMLEQAENSLSKEPDCHYFDVVVDESKQNIFYLYELYTNANAFATHLDSQHFKDFNQATSSMIVDKVVQLGNRL